MLSCHAVLHLLAYISHVWKTFFSTVGCDGNIYIFSCEASLCVEHQNRPSFTVANSKAALELDVFIPMLTHWSHLDSKLLVINCIVMYDSRGCLRDFCLQHHVQNALSTLPSWCWWICRGEAVQVQQMKYLFVMQKLRLPVALSSSSLLLLHFITCWSFQYTSSLRNSNSTLGILDVKEIKW
jgi:hypothetical protein